MIYFFISTPPFDQIIEPSFIYSFLSARPFDQKLGSSLIYFFHLDTVIRQKYMIFFLSFILFLCTTIQSKIRFLIFFFFFLFVRNHSTKVKGHSYSQIFYFLNCTNILFALLPLYFVRYNHTLIFIHYIHGSATLIFRTLYPWLYEFLAFTLGEISALC